MKTFISMLRGINVGGNKKISMAELKKVYEDLGLKYVQTFIQSGNVLFKFQGLDIDKLRDNIEKGISFKFGFDVKVLIRTTEELQNTIKKMPFKKEDTERVYITFLSDKPAAVPEEEINKYKNDSEKYFISGKEIYILCPTGYGKTKLSNNFFEKKLKVSATTRNWNSVNKLFAIASKP
jgi:uncharacterized protein (DUF1697 family)